MERIYRDEGASRRELAAGQDMPLKYGWIAIALFAFVVAALGGSSRPDAAQIAALRPLAALFLVPAVYFATQRAWADLRVPMVLLSAFAALVIIQLVPLPPAIWQSLPGRELVADLAKITGSEELWRPISMVPGRTMNALASLIVPIAALAMVASMRSSADQLLLTIVGLGLANAVLAIMQTVAGGSEALYPYAITNMGSPVGLFANQNHAGVFGAVTLVILAYLLAGGSSIVRRRWHRGALLAAILVVMMGALTGGSRAGLLATFLAISACAAMIGIGLTGGRSRSEALPSLFGKQLRPTALLAAMAVLVGGVIGLFLFYDRIPALQSLADAGSFEDLRWRLLPSLQAMTGHYWFFGSGIGSFEEVYHIYEPTALLEKAYVNQAHNDWAQLLIEGGVIAVLCVAGLAFWVVRQLRKIGSRTRLALTTQLFWLTFFVILLLASLVDYPLRTPLFQFVAVLCIAVLARQTPSSTNEGLRADDPVDGQENTFAYRTATVNAANLEA